MPTGQAADRRADAEAAIRHGPHADAQGQAVYGPGPHQHCDGKVGKALAFEYTSNADYRGRDGFEVRVRYSDGEIRHGRYEVEVR
ncbi:hypothetical protein QO058_17540 [Bosea vestrisii]|uniref:hypothetical protein n=1 Tax=Bosea vestrisii TaxID=151416 RepID=UPI0024DF8B4E|nr:hypothetical protein [Bosea vestrisii]WID94632.1 hypothetical protein QO058_17540 [Bosea vestrisii]